MRPETPAEAMKRLNKHPRQKDDAPGFPGQADWGQPPEREVSQENPIDNTPEFDVDTRDAVAASILAGTAVAALLDRAAQLVPLLTKQGLSITDAQHRAALTVANTEVTQ